MKGIRNAHGMLLYFLFLYTYIISFFVQQFQRLVFFVCVREIETDIEINRVRKRDRELRKLGSSFPIYI